MLLIKDAVDDATGMRQKRIAHAESILSAAPGHGRRRCRTQHGVIERKQARGGHQCPVICWNFRRLLPFTGQMAQRIHRTLQPSGVGIQFVQQEQPERRFSRVVQGGPAVIAPPTHRHVLGYETAIRPLHEQDEFAEPAPGLLVRHPWPDPFERRQRNQGEAGTSKLRLGVRKPAASLLGVGPDGQGPGRLGHRGDTAIDEETGRTCEICRLVGVRFKIAMVIGQSKQRAGMTQQIVA